MRAFIVLALIALARADVGGYNYEAKNAGGLVGGISGGLVSGGHTGSVSHGGSVTHGDSHGHHVEAPAEVEKEFYTFTAPEGEFDDAQPLSDLASSLKKNLQVIFIRGPENNGLANAALNLAKSGLDSKTAIYVLTKQNDASELANKLQNANNHNAQKPEVHFVKYRTPEDAANAQHAIQSQYNQLGGASQSHDGGVAPVLDFASKPVAVQHHQQQHHGGSVAAPASSYIPPKSPSATYLPIVKY